MDTPSSKNGSYLVIAVGIMALVSLVIGVFGLIKARDIEKKIAGVTDLVARVDAVEQTASKADSNLTNWKAQTQRNFDQVTNEFMSTRTTLNRVQTDMKAVVDKIAEMETRPAVVASSSGGSGGSSTPAGPAPGTLAEDGTYVIKSGDYFAKLAKEWGCSVDDIQRANPGVDSRRLRVGQKIVVPKK